MLVPATMRLMGAANWWLPGWLDRLLPHSGIEGVGGLPAPELHDPSPARPARRARPGRRLSAPHAP